MSIDIRAVGRKYFNRGLVDRVGQNISILQFIGVAVMLFGIGYFLVNLWRNRLTPQDVSVDFFIIMLGYSLAFPSLLKGNDGLSTMRIVVFMMTNVICMLLLKIGWSAGSLETIKLDEYWMGIIAFVFGAKATQSYFESKMAVPQASPAQGMAAVTYTNADIAKLAVAQNEQFLKTKFPNILSVSDAVDDLDKPDSHVVALYLKDDSSAGIPDRLEAKMPDGTIKTIGTEIVKEVGNGGIQINQNDEIRNGISHGSVCCIIETEQGDKKIVTAGHVYSLGNNKNYNGVLDAPDQTAALINKEQVGNWFFQIINFKTDVALASIDSWQSDDRLTSFAGKKHYEVRDEDIKKTKVRIVSNVSQPQTRDGYILDHNTAWDIDYKDITVKKSNIIVIGNSIDRDNSISISQEGDSGGCVYEVNSGNLVGLILGGNKKYTWVLSLKEIFEIFNYNLI